jgi:exopolysaccharide biosynthesis WecB/TagA/CpsF family protein
MPYLYYMRAASLIKRLTLVRDETERELIIEALQKPGHPLIVSFLNAHAFNLAWNEYEFRRTLIESDLLLRDGIGVSILLRLLRITPGLNMSGTDLIPKMLAHCGGSVALLGTRDPFLSKAADRLAAKGIAVCMKLDGFQPAQTYVDAVSKARPTVVIIAMGVPKQEHVARLLKEAIDWPCLIVNGGAILDFISGRVRRAPNVIQQLRLEWMFRLLQEPKRLWRRYVLGNWAFLFRSLRIWQSTQREYQAGVPLRHDQVAVGVRQVDGGTFQTASSDTARAR